MLIEVKGVMFKLYWFVNWLNLVFDDENSIVILYV